MCHHSVIKFEGLRRVAIVLGGLASYYAVDANSCFLRFPVTSVEWFSIYVPARCTPHEILLKDHGQEDRNTSANYLGNYPGKQRHREGAPANRNKFNWEGKRRCPVSSEIILFYVNYVILHSCEAPTSIRKPFTRIQSFVLTKLVASWKSDLNSSMKIRWRFDRKKSKLPLIKRTIFPTSGSFNYIHMHVGWIRSG